jgi:hypothetical protein
MEHMRSEVVRQDAEYRLNGKIQADKSENSVNHAEKAINSLVPRRENTGKKYFYRLTCQTRRSAPDDSWIRQPNAATAVPTTWCRA